MKPARRAFHRRSAASGALASTPFVWSSRTARAQQFLKAVALVKGGWLSKMVTAHVAIGGAPTGGPFPTDEPLEGLAWNMWVGPAQAADYSSERRKGFRWYCDYSGCKMTDWGAHHIDIAQWEKIGAN